MMASQKICDRYGAVINPLTSTTFVRTSYIGRNAGRNDYELCASCAHRLKLWLEGEEMGE